jgi:hypothetical protein
LEHCRDVTTGPFIIVIEVRETWSQRTNCPSAQVSTALTLLLCYPVID